MQRDPDSATNEWLIAYVYRDNFQGVGQYSPLPHFLVLGGWEGGREVLNPNILGGAVGGCESILIAFFIIISPS
jgi:hypothetical protein